LAAAAAISAVHFVTAASLSASLIRVLSLFSRAHLSYRVVSISMYYIRVRVEVRVSVGIESQVNIRFHAHIKRERENEKLTIFSTLCARPSTVWFQCPWAFLDRGPKT
jgi:hypothetical protein